MEKAAKKKIESGITNILFPCLLFLYPLLKVNQGIDVTDTCYTLANMRFFPELSGTWAGAVYLSNLTGYLLMRLPFGNTMLGMNVYTGLLVSGLALAVYFWYRKRLRMPAGVLFAGELIAIGLCWCPKVILYNYLTYVLFTLAAICLYEALRQEKNSLFYGAGALLGFNLLVRFPSNLVEAGLILAVWYYAFLQKKTAREVLARTGVCIAGYVTGAAAGLGLMLFRFEPGEIPAVLLGTFGMADSAGDYTLTAMLASILSAYRVAVFRWGIYMLLGIAAGMVMFWLRRERFLAVKKALYCAGMLVLLRFFWGRGMFNFKYDTYESMFQWGMLFLILSLLFLGGCLVKKAMDPEEKLLAAISLLIILLTPLGSNNYTYPNLNNLFLVAPFVLWLFCRRVLWLKNRPLHFPWLAMTGLLCGMLFVQSLGFGCRFVFRDSDGGEKRDTKVENCAILKGMYTNAENAASLQGVVDFVNRMPLGSGQRLLTYGTVPGMGYILDMAPALSTGWADLDTYPYERFVLDMEQAADNGWPVILLGRHPEPVTDSRAAREQAAKKEALLAAFMEENQYRKVFENQDYSIYERTKS